MKESGDADVIPHGSGQYYARTSATRRRHPGRSCPSPVRRVHEADLRLGGETRRRPRPRQRGPQLRNPRGTSQHSASASDQSIKPRGHGRRRASDVRPGRHQLRPPGPLPTPEQGGQGNAAVPHAPAGSGLHGRFERDAADSARLQGIHRGPRGRAYRPLRSYPCRSPLRPSRPGRHEGASLAASPASFPAWHAAIITTHSSSMTFFSRHHCPHGACRVK